MILGWKTELAKKFVETIVLNFAALAVKELFVEGTKFVRSKFQENQPSEEESSEPPPEETIAEEESEVDETEDGSGGEDESDTRQG